jgi:hypothetical protein
MTCAVPNSPLSCPEDPVSYCLKADPKNSSAAAVAYITLHCSAERSALRHSCYAWPGSVSAVSAVVIAVLVLAAPLVCIKAAVGSAGAAALQQKQKHGCSSGLLALHYMYADIGLRLLQTTI